ncbi:E3 SUMO-protein ligase ZBED1-like, partial [Scomber scombrus]
MNGDFVDYNHLRDLVTHMGHVMSQTQLQILSRFNLPKVYNVLIWKIHKSIPVRGLPPGPKWHKPQAPHKPEEETVHPEDVQAVEDQDGNRPMVQRLTYFISYVTASKLLPLCKGLQRVTVLNQRNVVVDKAKELANTLCASMDRKFLRMEYDPVLSETTALDPRFKKFAFSDNRAVDEALQRISAAAARCNPSSLSVPPSEGQEGEVGAGVGSEEPQASAVWRLFDERATGDTGMRNSTADAVLEVRSYLQEPLIQRAEDPLKWWEAKASCYPRLVK